MALMTAPSMRCSRVRFGGGAAASCSACCTNSSDTFGVIFSPVNSRKLPQDPQKASVSALCVPHLRQAIMS
jgi:hypothetical protein